MATRMAPAGIRTKSVTLIRTRRRSLALHIRPDGALVVRAPRLAGDRQIEKFVREHAGWIERTRQKILERKSRADAWRAQFPHDDDTYKCQALVLFTERCEFFAAPMGVSYKKIGLSNASTRWGSCSPHGNVRLNWRLVMAPPEVIDYVVIHELAHLKEMNHSKRFWAIVARFAPAYRDSKRWLRQQPI